MHEAASEAGAGKSDTFRKRVSRQLKEGFVKPERGAQSLVHLALNKVNIVPEELVAPHSGLVGLVPPEDSGFASYGSGGVIMTSKADMEKFVESVETLLKNGELASTCTTKRLGILSKLKENSQVLAQLGKWKIPAVFAQFLPQLEKIVSISLGADYKDGLTFSTAPEGCSLVTRLLNSMCGYGSATRSVSYDVLPFNFDSGKGLRELMTCEKCLPAPKQQALPDRTLPERPQALPDRTLPERPQCEECANRFDALEKWMAFLLAVQLHLIRNAGAQRAVVLTWGSAANSICLAMDRHFPRHDPFQEKEVFLLAHPNAAAFSTAANDVERFISQMQIAANCLCDSRKIVFDWNQFKLYLRLVHCGYDLERFSVRLVSDGALQLFQQPQIMVTIMARTHFSNLKANQKNGGLVADDIDGCLHWTKEKVKSLEDLREALGAPVLRLTVEFTEERYPKYRKPVLHSYGDLGRVIKRLKKNPNRWTDGKRTRTISNELFGSALQGFKNPTGTMPELIQHCATQDTTTVCNVAHGDALAFDPTVAGLQFWHSTDRDGMIQLAMSPNPELGRWFVVTEWRSESGYAKVCDALDSHDKLVRSFLPSFVKVDETPSLAFVKTLSKEEASIKEQNRWLLGRMVDSQNGASDSGAQLRHRSKDKGSQVKSVGVPDILRKLDAYAVTCGERLATFEDFRKFCSIESKSRLGGAARGEDEGLPWAAYRLQLAFAGKAQLILTRQDGMLRKWLEFLNVSEDAVTKYEEVREFSFPEGLFNLKPVAVAADVLERTAANLIQFVNDASAIHEAQIVKQRSKEDTIAEQRKKARKERKERDPRIGGSRFAHDNPFMVLMAPHKPFRGLDFESLDESSFEPNEESSFEEDEILPGDNVEISSGDEMDISPSVVLLESDAKLTVEKAERCLLEEANSVAGKAKKSKTLSKKAQKKGPRKSRAGKLEYGGDDDGDDSRSKKSKKSKKSKNEAILEEYVEDLGSLAGQRRLWPDGHGEIDARIAKAIEVADELHSSVKHYADHYSKLADVLLGVAKRLALQRDSSWPILSNAFWILCLQSKLLKERSKFLDKTTGIGLDPSGITAASGRGLHVPFPQGKSYKETMQDLADVFQEAFDEVTADNQPLAESLVNFASEISTSHGNGANMALGNKIGAMIRRGFQVNSRTLAVDIIRQAIIRDKCFGPDEDYRWSARDIELLLCGIRKREKPKENDEKPEENDEENDDEDAAEQMEEWLIKGELVELPDISKGVQDVVDEVREIFRVNYAIPSSATRHAHAVALKFEASQYLERAHPMQPLGKMVVKVQQLEELFRRTTGRTLWAGFKWIPERQKQWRASICGGEMTKAECFGKLRVCLGGNEKFNGKIDKRFKWMDVLRACAALDSTMSEEEIRTHLRGDQEKQKGKRRAFNRFLAISKAMADTDVIDSSLISDGVSLQLMFKKDVSAALRERLSWKSGPLRVRGLSRLCLALDRVIEREDDGFMCCLESAVAKRRAEKAERIFDLDAIWEAIEQWAKGKRIDVQEVFSHVMKSNDEVGDSDDKANDTLRKSRLFAELPATIAARLFSPVLLATIPIFSFDFGLCKWIGGGVMLPTDQGPDAERLFQPYTVRGGEYHHKIGSNRARSHRAKGGMTPALEAKLRRALECGKTRLFREILRDMREIADRAQRGSDFIIIVGEEGIGSGRCHRKPATKEFLKFLQEFALVIQMPERNTSKLCPRCWTEASFYCDSHPRKNRSHRKEIRTKWCTSATCSQNGKGFAYDRDTAAGVSFVTIFYSMVQGWGRPSVFEKPNEAVKLTSGAFIPLE